MNTFVLSGVGFASIPQALDRSVTRLHSQHAAAIAEPVSASISLDEANRQAVEALAAVAEESRLENWDGFGARAVVPETIGQAAAFVESLPSTVPSPEISAHPDGEISFFWALGARRTLVVSISPAGRLSFASLLGHRRFHGTEYFVNGLPETIARSLRELYSEEA